MTNQLQQSNIDQLLSDLVMHGDLSKLSSAQKVEYYNGLCKSLNLNPLTRPFEYMRLNGKEILYAKKDCAEQLRRVHNISIYKLEKETLNDVYLVTAYARDGNGREDVSTGAVSISGLKGEALANAYLKCETKAKRRVTLSIGGLGMLDETETESIRDITPPTVLHAHAALKDNKSIFKIDGESRTHDQLYEYVCDMISGMETPEDIEHYEMWKASNREQLTNYARVYKNEAMELSLAFKEKSSGILSGSMIDEESI